MTARRDPGGCLPPAGYDEGDFTVTCAPDGAWGGWWADLRDASGRLVETGNGPTQEAARANLRERFLELVRDGLL